MFNLSLLDTNAALKAWYESDSKLIGVSHDGEFIVLIRVPSVEGLEFVALEGATNDELMTIGGDFLLNDNGRVLIGQAEVFKKMYLTTEYQQRIAERRGERP